MPELSIPEFVEANTQLKKKINVHNIERSLTLKVARADVLDDDDLCSTVEFNVSEVAGVKIEVMPELKSSVEEAIWHGLFGSQVDLPYNLLDKESLTYSGTQPGSDLTVVK